MQSPSPGWNRAPLCLIRLPLLVSLIGAAGCGENLDPSPVTSEGVHEAPVAAPEASWEAQLAEVRSGRSSQVRLTGEVTAEEWSQLTEGCDGLMVLDLPGAAVTDEQLSVLPSLVSLRQLVLGAPIGDAGLATLAQCSSLEIVNLPQGQFSDAGLATLRELPLLTLLRFGSPHVTDAGMAHLVEMPNLRFLHLLRVPVTDAGLDQIKNCALLESFYIDGGECSDEGLSCLLKARPGLHLHVDQLHLAGDEHADDHKQ